MINSNGLLLNAFGYSDSFVPVSSDHGLDGVDITPFMAYNQHNTLLQEEPSTDYGYSCCQHNRRYAVANYQSGSDRENPEISSPYPGYNNDALYVLIADSQVVYYTRTSYVNKNEASSITYVNFCANGLFQLNNDGPFPVEGNYVDNAQGLGYGQNSGSWKLVTYQGQTAVYMNGL